MSLILLQFFPLLMVQDKLGLRSKEFNIIELVFLCISILSHFFSFCQVPIFSLKYQSFLALQLKVRLKFWDVLEVFDNLHPLQYNSCMAKNKKKQKSTFQKWRLLRADHLRLYPECRICDIVNKSNHVHHLKYRGKKGESEKPGDLVTLCKDHHNELHQTIGNRKLYEYTLQFIEEKTLELSYKYQEENLWR